jgi:hypothetical protein
MKRTISLQNKIFILVIGVLVISVGTIAWFGYKSTSDAYYERAFDLSRQNTHALGIEISERLEHIPKDIHYVNNLYALRQYLIWKSMAVEQKENEWKQVLTDTFIDFLETKESYYQMRILDLGGQEIIINTHRLGKGIRWGKCCFVKLIK